MTFIVGDNKHLSTFHLSLLQTNATIPQISCLVELIEKPVVVVRYFDGKKPVFIKEISLTKYFSSSQVKNVV